MPRSKARFFDVLAGFAAFVLLIATLALTRAGFDTRLILVVSALLFFCAGVVRSVGAPSSAWLRGSLVSSLPAIAIMLLSASGNAFTDKLVATILVVVIAGMSISGVQSAHLWSAGFRDTAVIAACTPLAVIVSVA